MIISILSSLKAQQDELIVLSNSFHQIDINQDGTLSYDELKIGLGKVFLLELL
jgi:Ca2+-binding EF-hand superfamily protein